MKRVIFHSEAEWDLHQAIIFYARESDPGSDESSGKRSRRRFGASNRTPARFPCKATGRLAKASFGGFLTLLSLSSSKRCSGSPPWLTRKGTRSIGVAAVPNERSYLVVAPRFFAPPAFFPLFAFIRSVAASALRDHSTSSSGSSMTSSGTE